MNNRYLHARYVLACRCGKAMAPEDMRHEPPSLGNNRLVRRIVCPGCAVKAMRAERPSRYQD